MFEVGQKVWDVLKGEGVVEAIESVTHYPIIVKFAAGDADSYMPDGKSHVYHKNPSLYPYLVEVKKVVKPSINWEHVHDNYKFLAQNVNGNAWRFKLALISKGLRRTCEGHSTCGRFKLALISKGLRPD